MPKPLTTNQRATAISSALFLLGFASIFFAEHFWPWIMLIIGIPLALRQYLLGRFYDMIISLIIFGVVFITAQFDVSWEILLPVIFITAAIYILMREFFFNNTPSTTEEEEEDLNIELEVESSEKKDSKKKV